MDGKDTNNKQPTATKPITLLLSITLVNKEAYLVTPTPHYASLVTELETAKLQIKAELKLRVKVKFDQLTDTVTSLTQKLMDLTRQNRDLKSQTGDLRKHFGMMKTDKAKRETHASEELQQEPSAPEVPVSNTGLTCFLMLSISMPPSGRGG